MQDSGFFYISLEHHSLLTQYYKVGLVGGTIDKSNKHPSFTPVFLSDVPFIGNDSYAICVSLTTQEINAYTTEINSFIRILKHPIPVSRVISLHVKNVQEAKNKIETDAISTAFLTTRIVDDSGVFGLNFERSSFREGVSAELNQRTKYFNQYLGAFSLLDLLATEDKNIDSLAHFISNVKNVNDLVANSLSYQELINKVGKREFLNYDVLYDSNSWNNPLFEYLFERKAINVDSFKSPVIKVAKYTGGVQFNNPTDIEQIKTAALVQFASYQGQVIGTIDNFIEELFFGKFKQESSFKDRGKLTFYIGFVNGYQNLSTYYNLHGKRLKGKFDLKTHFDNSLFESLYQFVFFDRKCCLNEEFFTLLDLDIDLDRSSFNTKTDFFFYDKRYSIKHTEKSIIDLIKDFISQLFRSRNIK